MLEDFVVLHCRNLSRLLLFDLVLETESYFGMMKNDEEVKKTVHNGKAVAIFRDVSTYIDNELLWYYR